MLMKRVNIKYKLNEDHLILYCDEYLKKNYFLVPNSIDNKYYRSLIAVQNILHYFTSNPGVER